MSSQDFVKQGRTLVDQGQYQEAVKVCRLGLLAHPTELDGRLVLGSALIALRRYDEVLAEMRVALEIDEANAWALALKGEALLRKGDPYMAAQVLNQAQSLLPSEPYISNLYNHAASQLTSGPPSSFQSEPSDLRTRNYPAHEHQSFTDIGPGIAGGMDSSDSLDSWPGDSEQLPPPVASLERLGIRDRTGTIELDPSVDGIEMLDEVSDDVIEPPSGAPGPDPFARPATYDTIDPDGSTDFDPSMDSLDSIDLTRTSDAPFDDSIDMAPTSSEDSFEETVDRTSTDDPAPEDSLAETRSFKPVAEETRELRSVSDRIDYLSSVPDGPIYDSPDIPVDYPVHDPDDEFRARDYDEPPRARDYDYDEPQRARDYDYDEPQRARDYDYDEQPRARDYDEPRPARDYDRGISILLDDDDDGFSAPELSQEETSHYNRAPEPPVFDFDDDDDDDFGVSGRADPVGKGRGDFRPERTAPETPRSRPRGPNARHPAAIQHISPPREAMPGLDELFPEDETGISKLSSLEEVVKQVRAPNQPTLAVSPVGIDDLGPSKSSDMRVIRAGLGLEPDSPSVNAGVPQAIKAPLNKPQYEPTEPVRYHKQKVPTYKPPKRVEESRSASGKGARDLVPEDFTATVPQRRSGWIYVLYVLVGLVVVAGGIFAGFKIRELRLDRQIRQAELKAETDSASDTYAGYLSARSALAGIVSARSNSATRSALARMRAALAAEFGDGYAEAKELIDKLGGADNVDIAVARNLLSLAEGDVEQAERQVRDIEKRYPDEPSGPYLAGQVALLKGQPEQALDAFNRALKRRQRPIVYIGLGRARIAKGVFSEAKAAFQRALDLVPGHPTATLGIAETVVASGVPPKAPDQPEAQLEALIASPENEPLSPSRRERAEAALLLVSLQLVRGNRPAARAALDRVRELRPKRDFRFSRMFIDALIDVGEIEAADREAKRAVDEWPNRVNAKIAQARVLLLLGKSAEAIQTLEGDLRNNPEALTVRAKAYLKQSDLEKAVADLDAVLKDQPDRIETNIVRAEAYLKNDEPKQALAMLEKRFSNTARPEVQIAYAAALRATGDVDKARAILTELTSTPAAGPAYAELALVARQQGDYKQAKETLAKALKLMPNDVSTRLEAADLELQTGRLPAARKALDELAETNPQNALVLVEAAELQILTGAHELAIENLNTAENLAPSLSWQVLRERGRLELKRGAIDKATELLARARSLNDKDRETHLLLIDAYFEADLRKELNAAVENTLNYFPRGEPIRDMARAQLDVMANRLDEALKAYNDAKKARKQSRASPRDRAAVLYRIGLVYSFKDDVKNALSNLERATKLDPGNAEAFYQVGSIYSYREQPKDAVKFFERAVDIDPMLKPQAWQELGIARLQLKRRKGAKQAFDELIKRFPKSDAADEARKTLEQLK